MISGSFKAHGKLNKYSEPYNFNIVDKPLITNEIFLESQLQKAVRRKAVKRKAPARRKVTRKKVAKRRRR